MTGTELFVWIIYLLTAGIWYLVDWACAKRNSQFPNTDYGLHMGSMMIWLPPRRLRRLFDTQSNRRNGED